MSRNEEEDKEYEEGDKNEDEEEDPDECIEGEMEVYEEEKISANKDL